MTVTTSPGTMTFIGSREAPTTIRQPESCCTYSPTGAHHWYIEPNTGKTSAGKCQHCGQSRVFWNWFDVMYRGDGVGDGNTGTGEF